MNYRMVSYKLFLCLVILSSYISPVRSQQSNSSGNIPFLRIVQSVNDLASTPAMVTNDCISVEQDGKFHLELRRQKLPSPTANLKIYEGILSKAQRDSLLSVLDDANLKGLPNSEIPRITPVNSFVKMVRVEIRRDNSLQKIGFGDWSREPSKSREGASAEEIEDQKRIEAKMQPLFGWFRRLQGDNLREVKTASTLCGVVLP